MEKTVSVEDKIRRAEEIYNRRKGNQARNNTAKVNVNSKKDVKLLKKMIIQIIVCLAIYSVFYLVKNNNYIFSEDLINKTKEILSYDINFSELYTQIMEKLNGLYSQEDEEVQEEQETEGEEGIGGSEEEQNTENVETEDTTSLSQMEQDALEIKNTISFIKPIEGTVTSTFGLRDPTTSTVPQNHTGIDIANVSGTVISSATDGDVILSSSEGDYRKPP